MIFLLLLVICQLSVCTGDVILTEGEITNVNLQSLRTTRLMHYVDRSKSDIKFITMEVHSQVINVTLSWTYDFTFSSTVRGQDVGVMTLAAQYPEYIYWYVKIEGSQTINTLMLVQYIHDNDPIPGGCNQVMNMQFDPNLLLSYTDYWSSVRFQWSNTAFPADCESTLNQKQLEYDTYVYFMKEASLGEEFYMDSMKKMMGVDNIIENGRKVMSITNDMKTKSNFSVSSITGQGAIYSVVVRQKGLGTVASYVSVTSYGCSLLNQTCEIDIADSEYVIGALCGIVGLCLCFFGHRFLKTELFIFGFLSLTIVSFLLLSRYTILSDHPVTLLSLSGFAGLLGGIAAVLFWWYFGIPVLSILFVGFAGGYLFSSVLFFTPFGNLDIWETEFSYWMAFTCALLLYPLCMVCFTKTLNIVTCAFVGSFLISILIDILLHTTLKLIILNTFNHAIITDYIKIKDVTPLQINDLILFSTWFLILIMGAVIQFRCAKDYAPFPPCPRMLRKRRLEQEQNRLRAMNDFDNERQPLIFERPPSYTQATRQELYQPT